MAFENLLRPGKINGMEMRNRFIAGPMEKAMANQDGTLNERYIHYSRERAKGGVALIQLESIYVRPEGRGNPFQVGCHDDTVIPGLRKFVDAIHEHGAKLTMEINHGGRQASITASQRQPIAPSVVPCTFIDPGSVPREMTREDIEIVIDAFAKAARRCLEAGVDMIHIRGAHGYLIGQFLSPHTNRRTDEYGGSQQNRARFALEILAAIRAVVGKDYPIGYRISAVEFVEGGLEIEESAAFCKMLADAGIDLIDVTASTYESAVKMFQGPESPKGGFVPYAAAIRRAVGDRVPVSVAQRLNDPEFASAVMEKEGFEYITLDPRVPRRSALRAQADRRATKGHSALYRLQHVPGDDRWARADTMCGQPADDVRGFPVCQGRRLTPSCPSGRRRDCGHACSPHAEATRSQR
jgi:2,4-dienoyl-CoA reductase-like NADH-dependent reductase (Old Yellow Enzyme family)